MLEDYYKNIKQHIHFMHTPVKYRYTEFHLHEYFEIYYFISGNAKYFIEKQIHSLKPGDLLITNNHEIHRSVVVPGQIYDVISMQVNPELIKAISSSSSNLLDCFIKRPQGENNKIIFKDSQNKTVVELLKKIEEIYNEQIFGSEILLVAYLTQLLVIINNSFNEKHKSKEKSDIPDRLIPILEYIDFYLHEDLTLETLEHRFNINRFYVCRLFKKTIGSTLHEYILFKRLSLAKGLLQSGKSVTDACQLSGFNDYSHFIRIFKSHIGISPGKFKKEYTLDDKS